MNFLVLIWFGRLFAKQIVFPYSIRLVQRQAHQFMNRKLALEMIKLMQQTDEILTTYMLHAAHKSILFTKYKEHSRLLVRMCDFVNLFATVNSKQIRKDAEKGKSRLSQLFRDITAALMRIEELIREIRVEPVKQFGKKPAEGSQQKVERVCDSLASVERLPSFANREQEDPMDTSQLPKHTIWSYYFGLGDFERTTNDTPQHATKGPNHFTTERHMPLIHAHDTNKVLEMRALIQQVMEYSEISHNPIPLQCGRRPRRRASCLGFCFKPIFGSTRQMGNILAKTFEGQRIKVPTEDDPKIKIDCMFFTATCEPVVIRPSESTDKLPLPKYLNLPTFILCNPNAMFYQYMVNQPHAYYLRFFLNKNINVMVWNYRGYGLTKGDPTPTNIRQDGSVIVKYLRETLGLSGKLGVYGRSLGGVVTTHLAEHADLIFADRTFSNFEVLSTRKFFSKMAKALFKMASGGWVINNDDNLAQRTSCYKVLMTERADEVIEVHSSLMTGVARAVLGRKHLKAGQDFYLSKDQLRGFISATEYVLNMEHDLYNVLESANAARQHQLHVLQSPGTRFFCLGRAYSRNHHSQRIHPDIEQSQFSETLPLSPLSTNNLLAGSTTVTASSAVFTDSEQMQRSVQSRELLAESLKRLTTVNFLDHQDLVLTAREEDEGLPGYIFDLWGALHALCNDFIDLQGGMLRLGDDIVGVNRYTSPFEVENFFILMEVYGETPELSTFINRLYDHKTQREAAKNTVEALVAKVQKTIERMEEIEAGLSDRTPTRKKAFVSL